MNGMQLFLKPKEQMFLAMAVVRVIEDLEKSATNVQYNWTPESRATLKDMLDAGKGLKVKMAGLGFDMRPLPDLLPGEENDYLTKES